ncbi:SDR family oxidoreductase [Actinoplanes sp. NBRC 101535]|uniref:SDR family oxidoreductase n=1 Tax=Actinoplanes sp. NBRC 101535 TaxID=3032196 RepID=UPI002557736E|nr:SDR family oxidoreductase [Actinoplanes sp. NBRC 101535]
MRILVVGGHGKVALLLHPLLVEAGHQVTAVIRNPDHQAEVGATGATATVADVEHLGVDDLAELLAGHDAIVWSAGAGGGNPARTYAVDRDAAIRAMDAATEAKIQRFVMVSYFGAGPEHGVDPENAFFAYADAKATADTYLEATSLDWTILRPSRLTDDLATGRIETASQGATAGSVSRADVAAVIANVLGDPATARQAIAFNNGATPIAEAVRSTP